MKVRNLVNGRYVDSENGRTSHVVDPCTAEAGGFKRSGDGKDLSMYGFEDYTRKHVMHKWG